MKLKPCPFCGSDSIRFFRENDGLQGHCLNCSSRGPYAEEYEDDEEKKAISAWNKRTKTR